MGKVNKKDEDNKQAKISAFFQTGAASSDKSSKLFSDVGQDFKAKNKLGLSKKSTVIENKHILVNSCKKIISDNKPLGVYDHVHQNGSSAGNTTSSQTSQHSLQIKKNGSINDKTVHVTVGDVTAGDVQQLSNKASQSGTQNITNTEAHFNEIPDTPELPRPKECTGNQDVSGSTTDTLSKIDIDSRRKTPNQTPSKGEDSDIIPDTPDDLKEISHGRKRFQSRSFLSSSSSINLSNRPTGRVSKPVSKQNKDKHVLSKLKSGAKKLEDVLSDQTVPSVEEKFSGQVAMSAVLSDMGISVKDQRQMGFSLEKVDEFSDVAAKPATVTIGAPSANRKRNGSQGTSPISKRADIKTTPQKTDFENKKFSSRGAEMVHNSKSIVNTGKIWRNPINIVESETVMSNKPDQVKENVKWGLKRESFTIKESQEPQETADIVKPTVRKVRKNIFASKTTPNKQENALDDILSELKAGSGTPSEMSRIPTNMSHTNVSKEKKELTMETEDLISTEEKLARLEGEDEALDDIMNELKTKFLTPANKVRSAKPVISPYTSLHSRQHRKTPHVISHKLSGRIDTHTKTNKLHSLVSPPKNSAKVSHGLDVSLDNIDSSDKENGMVDGSDTPDTVAKDACEVAMEMETEADIDMEAVAKEMSRMSPFKLEGARLVNPDDFELPEVPPTIEFGRHKVVSVQHDRQSTVLSITDTSNNEQRTVTLHGFWSDVHVREGDIVNVLGNFDDNNECHVTDKENLLIVHPDLLISGTSVVSCMACMRRSVLNEKFKGMDKGNIYMLYGSIIHSLFQQVLQERAFSRPAIDRITDSILQQPKFLHEMYGQSVTEAVIREEIEKYIPQILKFVEKYVPPKSYNLGQKLNPDVNTAITNIADIEENVWSPRYGIKGKIDMTVEVKICEKSSSSWRKKVMPLELKTGKASFSVEHKGQVTLYSMMFSDRRADPESGLLLYLKAGQMETIPASHINKRGLIQLRNELAHYLKSSVEKHEDPLVKDGWRFGKLPTPINRENMCTRCPQLISCSLYQRTVEEWEPPSGHIMESLCSSTLSHLRAAHLQYFSHWAKLLHLEICASQKRGGILDLWCKTGWQRERSGECFSNMELILDKGCEVEDEKIVLHFKRTTAHPSNVPLVDVGLNKNDSVVVSAENKPLISLSTGTIRDIEGSTIILTLDRDLRSYPEYRDVIYRLDKCDNFNTMGTNFANIARLLEDNPHSAKLREVIIERRSPRFEPTLPKSSIEKVKSVFKSLNKPQKTAILKVLMSQDYVLIKGFPGTGKTSTIVALVRVLVSLGQSVLLASFTHSAVDNILLKLKQYRVDFLRLGRAQRIHSDILPYSAEVLARKTRSVDDLRQLYLNQSVVATTCLGTNHVLFGQRMFDVCIVDEASQVLQPTCFGPLLCSRKFVLVGDPLQLAPVVLSREAKAQGLDESLFARLDDSGATYELNLQYRMNQEIMRLSNELVYNGALSCGSKAVSTATLALTDTKHLGQVDPWLQTCLDATPGHEVMWLDTQQLGDDAENNPQQSNPAKHKEGNMSKTRNFTEAKLVLEIVAMTVKCGVSEESIGVITPYRQQVWLLREILRQNQLPGVEVNTVDQYQGRDKDIIIMSFVKSVIENTDTECGSSGGILNDLRRLNVAVTRAKHKLILIGSIPALLPYQPVADLLSLLRLDQVTVIPNPK